MNIRKLQTTLVACATACLMAMLFLSCTAFSADGVAVNDTNFPDANFRAYVSEKIDDNSDLVLSESEILNVKEIHISNSAVSSLKGIEYFTNLEFISCIENELTSLDLSHNTKLVEVACSVNNISSLKLNAKSTLVSIFCTSNKLTSLDLSGYSKLREIYSDDNQLLSINVKGCSVLSKLSCSSNNLSELDVSDNTELKYFYCGYNKLKELNVSNNKKLLRLRLDFNKLESIDLKNNTELIELYCSHNLLRSLDISKNINLEIFSCLWNYFTHLDLSKNTKLSDVSINYATYELAPKTKSFCLDNIPGFDSSRVTSWSGCTYNEDTNTITNFKTNRVEYSYDCGNGKSYPFTFLIPTYLNGDVNSDGKVDLRDVVLLYQKVSNQNVYIDEFASNVNNDTAINIRDVVLLFQYVSRWDVVLQ